jgi:type III secretory pathway component EscT
MPSIVGAVVDELARGGVDVAGLGRVWARAMPSIALVPAFGLRALPAPSRALMGLALAACVVPALPPLPAAAIDARDLAWTLAAEVARGLPVAIAAAVPLWAATMAGGVADALRGASEGPSLATVEGRPTQTGALFSLLACALFLSGGGPARVAAALALVPPVDHPLLAATADLTRGIALAVALGAPLLAAGMIAELASALVARAASPAQVQALLSPLKALGMLLVTALVFERVAAVLAQAVAAAP